MKPLRMELEGFARFAEPQTVSFEDLSLFAISGPTGAGKTLVLDALSYALYGVTPRLSQKLDGLISSGRDRLVVDLQFEAGSGTYRVVRSMERKQSGAVSKATRLEHLQDARWVRIPETEKLKEADARLEQIIGLDFRAFTRSILLPQGKFDEFLHGEPRQRRNLLKELLDLGRVDRMREEAGKRERDAATQTEFITGRLSSEGLEEAPGKLRELQAELAALELTVRSNRQQLEASRKELAETEALGRLHTELAELTVRLDRQLEAARRAPELKQELQQGTEAASLLPLLEEVERLEKEADESGRELEQLAGRHKELKERADSAAAASERASQDLQKTEPELRQRLAVLQQLLPLAQRLERLGGAPAGVTGDSADWDEARFEVLQQLQARLPGLVSAQKRRDESVENLEGFAAAAAAQEKSLTEARDQLAEVRRQGTEASERIDALEAEAQLLHKQSGDAAAALRDGLVRGESCPVCGQLVHELPGHSHGPLNAVNEELARIRKQREELRDAYRTVESAVNSLSARLEAQARSSVAAQNSLDTALKELGAYLAEFSQAGLDGTVQQLEGEVKRQFGQQVAGLAAKIGEHGTDPQETARELDSRLKELVRSEREAGRALTQAERELLQLEGQVQTKQAVAARVDSDVKQQRTELQRRLLDTGIGDREAVRLSSRPKARLEELERILRQLDQELDRLKARQLELTTEIGGRTDRRGELPRLSQAVTRLENDLHTQSELRGNLQAATALQKERSEQRKVLLQERRKHEDEREVWRLLALDLRDDRFTDFLLGDLQRRLARRASHIIRQVTSDRFDLHLSEAREFEVTDAWADGERRSATNLSGGETFIVSLALALALSDSAAGGRRLGALFLDEGFGTLDAQTLDSVAAVLESLSTDGRMVGLITHVPELSERMPARLMVKKDAEGSSLYWED